MSQSTREGDRDRIVESMETIIQALMGNVLETIRLSVSDLRAETERRIDGLKEETKGSLETLRADLLSSDENVKREAITAVENRTNSVADRSASRLETATRDLNQKLDEAESRLQKAHLALSERLDGAERGLVGHEQASGRISEVLETLGHVLARENAPPESPTLSPAPTPVSIGDSGLDHDGLPTEVEMTLPEPTQPSVIETQPLPLGDSGPMDAEEVEGALDRVALTRSTPTTPHGTE